MQWKCLSTVFDPYKTKNKNKDFKISEALKHKNLTLPVKKNEMKISLFKNHKMCFMDIQVAPYKIGSRELFQKKWHKHQRRCSKATNNNKHEHVK